MTRRRPISKPQTNVVYMNGVFYNVKKAPGRSSKHELLRNGLIARFNFDENFEWLNDLVVQYSEEKALRHPPNLPIAGCVISVDGEDQIWAEVKHEQSWKDNVYLINSYNLSSRACELQIMCDINGPKAIYAPVCEQKIVRTQEDIITEGSAASMALILLGVKLFLNLVKYELYDETTGTEGPREIEVKPFSCFGYKDYLLQRK